MRGGCLFRHPSTPQRQRIGHRGKRPATPPAPYRANVDGVVGRGGIEVVPIWKAAVLQLVGATDVIVWRLAHRHEHDPITSGCRPCCTSDDLDNVGNGVQASDGNSAA